jgi:hypothetical protein
LRMVTGEVLLLLRKLRIGLPQWWGYRGFWSLKRLRE